VTLRAVAAPAFFPPLQRVAIDRVACPAPQAYGVHVSRWDCRTLPQVVVEQAIVDSIHYTTVAHILARASLQPHRSRYWKTARVEEEFLRLAAKVLWGYGLVDWLHRRGEVVIGMEEKPNIPALRRVAPTQLMGAGRIERREFEYERKGGVHFLVAFNVYDGTMLGGWTEMTMSISCGACAKSNGAMPRRAAFISVWTTGAPISRTRPTAISPAVRVCAYATPPPMARGAIRQSCGCARLRRSPLTGLIRSPVNS